MTFLENIPAFLFVLGVMVLIHELGHFLAARFFDVRVESFAFGFGPRLFGFKRGETDYRVCLLPLGGYVKMAGDSFGEPSGDPNEFLAKPRWQRLIIAAMGPIFNGILAVALLVGLYMYHYERYAFLSQPAVVADVIEGSAAETAGIRPGDRILSVDGVETPDWESVKIAEVSQVHRSAPVLLERDGERLTVNLTFDADERGIGVAGWTEAHEVTLEPVQGRPAFEAGVRSGDVIESINSVPVHSDRKALELIQGSDGKPLDLALRRDDRTVYIQVQPEWDEPGDPQQAAWRIGALLGARVVVTKLGFGAAMEEAVEDTAQNATLIFGFLKGMFEQRMSARSLEGPIGIARLSGEAARRGLPELVNLMSAISLNLGIFNLLPIPILDGGVILMLLVESLIRRDLSLALKERIIQAGLVFLVLLFAFVMYNDILRSLPSS